MQIEVIDGLPVARYTSTGVTETCPTILRQR